MNDAAAAVLAVRAYRAAMRAPLPVDRKPLGCLLCIVSVVAALAMPPLALALGLPPEVAGFGIMILCVVFLVAVVMSVFGGTRRSTLRHRRMEAALQTLADPDSSERRRVKAAARIVAMNLVSDGPASYTLLSTDLLKERLGDALPFVERVERSLIEGIGAWPVVTDLEP